MPHLFIINTSFWLASTTCNDFYTKLLTTKILYSFIYVHKKIYVEIQIVH